MAPDTIQDRRMAGLIAKMAPIFAPSRIDIPPARGTSRALTERWYVPVPDDSAPSLCIEPRDEEWAIVAGGEVIALFADQADAEALLEIAKAKAAEGGDRG